VLPAILAVVGHNVNRWQVRRPSPVADDQGRWYRLAMVVMRRPIPIATAGLLFLLVLGAPFLRVELGFPDERVLPPEATTREVGEILRLEFNAAEATPTVVVASGIGDPQARANDVGDYARELSRLPGVARVDALTGSYLGGTQVVGPTELSGRFAVSDATWLTVIPSVETLSADGEQLVRDVRAVDAPFEVLVGGPSAELLDGKAGMFDRLPLALLVIALVTFIVLFLSFGSVLMPLKAIVLNLLSLSATFGALVWVFQDGRFESLLGFTATGTLVITMPVLMFITAFGLSMDYEVFLLSRVREEFDRTGDNTLSVARGLERTGRIVTAAAVLISVVFLSFALGRVSFITMFGLGMALAVLVDAFIVRTTLVPAFMRLAGRANWWAPAPLQRVYDRIGFREVVDLDLVAASAPDPNPRPASTPG
jgi:putative drug exporter of the RND superfamily